MTISMLGKIVLLGEPKSTQHIYGILCRPYPTVYLKREGKAIKEDYSWQAKSQWRKPLLSEPFGITVRFYHKTKRKQDIDNFFKLLFDSLSRVVWEDDNLIHQMNVTKHHDPLSPRIEIEFFSLES
jgi:Holliday junction resolvase RusA-like endonuclease